MSDLEQAELLLRIAERDIRSLRVVVGEGAFADENFGFMVQQAVEKALKAWLALKGIRYPLVHSIGRLNDLLAEAGEDVSEFEDLDWVTAFAVDLRYDELGPVPPSVDRREMLERAESLLNHVLRLAGS